MARKKDADVVSGDGVSRGETIGEGQEKGMRSVVKKNSQSYVKAQARPGSELVRQPEEGKTLLY